MNLGLGLNIATTKSGGAIVPALEYQSRVIDSGASIVSANRSIDIYLEVTSIATPSLLCACDAYELSSLGSTGKLFNIIPE